MAKIPLQIVLTLCLEIQRLRVDAVSKEGAKLYKSGISADDRAAEPARQNGTTREFSVDFAGNVDKGIVRKVAIDVVGRSEVPSKQDAIAHEYSVDFAGHIDLAGNVDKTSPARDPGASVLIRKAPFNVAGRADELSVQDLTPRNVSPDIIGNSDTISSAREYGAGKMPKAASTVVERADWNTKQDRTMVDFTVATSGAPAVVRAPAAWIRPHGEAALIASKERLKARSQAQSTMPLSVAETESTTAPGIATTAPVGTTTAMPVAGSTTAVLPAGEAAGTSDDHTTSNAFFISIVFLLIVPIVIAVHILLRKLLWHNSSDAQSPSDDKRLVRKESSVGFSRRSKRANSTRGASDSAAAEAPSQGTRSQGTLSRYATPSGSHKRSSSSRYGAPSESEHTDASVRSSRGRRVPSSEPPQQDRENLKQDKKESKGSYRHRKELAADQTDDAALEESDIAL